MRFLLLVGTAVLSAASAASAASSASQPVVVDPRVSTDRSVDTSTIDRIVASLVRDGMSDEQKVVAVFNWIRTVLYHGDGPAETAYDFGKMIHSLGNGSCLRQTTPLAVLLERLGYPCRSWVHDGHHMIEVKYGGKWHCMDPHMTFYVYDRSEPPTIASVEQLRADRTLAFDAVAEGRACPGFLQCGDTPKYFGPGGNWVLDAGWPKAKIDEPFGRITMPRGQTYTRTWMPGPQRYRFLDAWKFDYGPYHTCSVRADRKDTVNWPLYEPHVAAVGKDGRQRSARHWATGKLVYKPELVSDHYRDAVVRSTNLTHDQQRGLVATDPKQPAEVVFTVDCPYVLTAGDLTLESTSGTVTAAVSTDGGESWQLIALRRQGQRLHGEFIEPINGSYDGYQLRLRLQDGAAIAVMELVSRFHLNPYSLPYLVPGRNVVKVDAARFGSPLRLEWTYAQGPEWTQQKTASKTFTQPGEIVIDVEGEKYPRNISLTLSVAP